MLEQFAKRVHDEVYKAFHTYKTTLFLCGAGKTTANSVREQIATALTFGPFSYKYDLFYPEDLFDELLLGVGHHDLLSLENILADSVDAVVLVIESYGAAAELGAFGVDPLWWTVSGLRFRQQPEPDISFHIRSVINNQELSGVGADCTIPR